MEICKKEFCTGCSACMNICPQECISMKINDEGFLYPEIDKSKCVNCGLCRKICPANSEIKRENRRKPKTIGAYNKDEKVLLNSSSGGVFSVLADYILSQNGVIYGAVLNENMKVYHAKAESKNEYEKMRGSKYLQSEIKFSYNETKKYLKEGRKVLFIGCPCQIAGLYATLDKEYENLITVDLICHGVGSKKFFDKYVKEKEEKYKDKIVGISFRDKKNGYSKFTTKIVFKKRKPIFIKSINDSYMTTYIKQGIYRESCYTCKFASIPRIGDITLGDFKGIKDKNMEKDFEKGISVVLLNNNKADKIFDVIKEKLNWTERPLEEATSSNRNIIEPSIRPTNRDKILKDDGTTKELQKKYYKRKKREYIADILGRKVLKIIGRKK